MNRNASSFLAILLILLVLPVGDGPLAGQPLEQPPEQSSEQPSVRWPEPPQLRSPPQLSEGGTTQGSNVQGSTSGPQDKIRKVLQGHQPAPTGDGVLEDILGVIQKQGSVLDGSLLDEPAIDEGSFTGQPKLKLDPAARRALVAEKLLRAARMLRQISDDESSLALIVSMRRQAGALLIASESPNR